MYSKKWRLKDDHLSLVAVTACQEVNPDNPLAVAESIQAMYEALKEADAFLFGLTEITDPQLHILQINIQNTLAKAEGSE